MSKRPIAFMLVATEHGPLITTRLDVQPGQHSNQVYDTGRYEPFEISCALELLRLRRKHYGDGVFAIDCGACFGVHSIEWSKLMTGWGRVLSFEAQERLFYAAAGNIALNNCFNVQILKFAVGNTTGIIKIPTLDYSKPARYGSLELKQRAVTEDIGQRVSYSDKDLVPVEAIRLDALSLPRVDLIKLDIEGMEVEALEGARNLLTTHKPFLIIEIIKSDHRVLSELLTYLGYEIRPLGRLDIVAIHSADRAKADVFSNDWSIEKF
jgi:FkbM family methyltransferase